MRVLVLTLLVGFCNQTNLCAQFYYYRGDSIMLSTD
jgi:hypothetical protein